MIKYFCDRCGKETHGRNQVETVCYLSEKDKRKCLYSGTAKKFHLCDNCANYFNKWMKEGEKKQ